MNFRTDTTKGGYKILSIHGPDANGWYAGVLEKAGDIGTVTWNQHGNSTGDMRDLDLIPLADEPEPSETTELWNEIEALREITVETLKRMNEMRTDYIARINGLRSDYLADQSAVQPSRVDALEERLDKFDDELGVLQDDVNLDLRLELRDLTKRLEALEQFKRATLAIREAVEQRTQPSDKGVWVTRESLKYAFDATQEFIMRNDRFKEIAERLGLEEEV
jgi:hypothetical protein